MWRLILLCLIMLNFASGQAIAQCGEYYDCEEPPVEYDDADLEYAGETVVDDYFSHCIKIIKAAERLSCYDRSMTDLGYEVLDQPIN